MTAFEIEKALNAQLVRYATEIANSIGVDNIAWANHTYTPVIDTPYIIPDFIAAMTRSVGVGLGTPNRVTGFYQLDVFTPSNQGKGDLLKIVDDLHEYFKRGTSITHDGTEVRITKFRPGPSFDREAWFVQTIQIDFRADLEN